MTRSDDAAPPVAHGLVGRDLLDHVGRRIGAVHDVHPHDGDGRRPLWLAVTSGLLGSRLTLVPYTGVWLRGDNLVSWWDADVVRSAPRVRDDDGRPSAEEEMALYQHYGPEWGEPRVAGHGPGPTGWNAELPQPDVDRHVPTQDPVVNEVHSTPDGRVLLETRSPGGPTIVAELHSQRTTQEIEGREAPEDS